MTAVARTHGAAVLFDRDGTLIRDVPYNGDPNLVEPLPGARACLDALRAAGVKLGVVTNQSAVGRGMITLDQVAAVNRRVERLLGRFDVWQVCPHTPWDGCACRKPAPGMILSAAEALRVPPRDCWVVGDRDSDAAAAGAAGAQAIVLREPGTDSAVDAHRVQTLGELVGLLGVGVSVRSDGRVLDA